MNRSLRSIAGMALLALLLFCAGLSACRMKPQPAPAAPTAAAMTKPALTSAPASTPAPTPSPSPSPTPTPTPTPATNAKTVGKIIEAEDYDKGGEGVGYHDTTPGNTGGKHQNDDVDIQDADGHGLVVAWIAEGEWLAYTPDFPDARFTFPAALCQDGVAEQAAGMRTPPWS